MPWDDPPKSSSPWHDALDEETGDIGRGPPRNGDSRIQPAPLGPVRGQSPSGQRDNYLAEDPDHLDDEEILHKRFSQPPTYCDSRQDVHKRKHNWLSLSVLVLSIYSTSLSCLWFVVALVQPRWGPQISSSGGILPSTASLVCAMFAKTIEISFVTVFVTFIGQVLTRRAFVRKSKGMTLAEMTMRNWVIQPGFLITHWETLPYAGITLLGAISLIATVASTFYTTASDAMVTPKLKFGGWESKTLSGYVLASYANPPFSRESCQTPLRDNDPAGADTAGRACLEIQYAGQSTNPVNKILQPNDLSGVGEYAIKASVVSPALNVMCVNISPEELSPLIYTEWPLGKNNSNETLVPGQRIGPLDWEQYVPPPSETEWLNRTSVDDVFRWGEQYQRRPPVFQLYPADFNMVTNTTTLSDAIYILTKSALITNYTLCEMRSWVTPSCSTHFNISGTAGSHMQAHCEDPDDQDSYVHAYPEVTFSTPVTDWKNIADQWRLSMDINGGTQNNNASNARILTQFVLQEPKLDPLLPSMAEALAVYASSTLVISGLGTPFEHYWRHEKTQLGLPGSLDPFNASIRTQQYTSGHVAEWQKVFYIILVLVFIINVFCLAYFLARSGLVTDFTEPQNLFALAVNSPPSEQLKGSCGGGPVERDLVVPWRVAYASSANHYFFEEANDRPWHGKYSRQDLSANTAYRGRERSSYNRLSTSNSWL
ncbi:hypothetical protein EsH8_V_000811 [Colletotrichum jinshuiense]